MQLITVKAEELMIPQTPTDGTATMGGNIGIERVLSPLALDRAAFWRRHFPLDSLRRILPSFEYAVTLLIVAAAIALHVIVLDRSGPLWRDEANTVGLASKSWGEMYQFSGADSFPLLWLTFLRCWMSLFGSSDPSLRLFGTLGGLLLLGSLFAAVRIMGGRWPFIALICFAINPDVVYWGDSMRAYGFGPCSAVMLTAGFWKLSQSDDRRHLKWVLFCALVAVGFQYTNCFFVASLALGACAITAWGWEWRRTVIILAIGAAAAVSMTVQIHALHMMSPAYLLQAAHVTWAEIWKSFGEATGVKANFLTWLYLGLPIFLIFSALLLLVRPGRLRAPGGNVGLQISAYCAVSITLLVPCYVLFLKHFDQPPKPSYFFGIMAVLAVMSDVVLAQLLGGSAWGHALEAITAFVLLVILLPSAWTTVHFRHSNVKDLVEVVQSSAHPGDLMLVSPFYLGVTVNHYNNGAIPWVVVPELKDTSIDRYDELKALEQSYDPCRTAFDRIQECFDGGHAVWLIGSLSFPAANDPLLSVRPAPDPKYGWNWFIYSRSWEARLGQFLGSRARHARLLEFRSETPSDGYEFVQLIRLDATK